MRTAPGCSSAAEPDRLLPWQPPGSTWSTLFDVEGSDLDEEELFRAIARSGARVLLIGRRAMIALGLPVMTADYDLWVHIDDIERLNAALAALDHQPNRAPAEARARGRYVLENSEHIDVVVAKAQTTPDGDVVSFDEVWKNKVSVSVGRNVSIGIPRVEDLIRTKRWAMRAKDVTDIQLLEALKNGAKS